MINKKLRVIEHIVPGQHIRGYPSSTRGRQEDVLKLAVKQYVPLDFQGQDADDAITILALHGLAFPKELYEPFFELLLSELRKVNVQVRGIWAADVANQNASGVLNEDLLGDQLDYFDHSRDLLAMVNHFRHDMPRPIIGFAHSFGCTMLTNLCTMHPRLLSAVILCEPIIFELARTPMRNPCMGPARRRDYWPTRAAAKVDLAKSYRKLGWAENVIDLFCRYGLRSLPTPLYDPTTSSELSQEGVTLVTTKHQEAWSFAGINWKEYDESVDQIIRLDQTATDRECIAVAPQITAAFLSELPRIRSKVLYLFGGRSPFLTESTKSELVTRTGTGLGGSGGVELGRVEREVLEQSGHMIPFEDTGRKQLATMSSAWIGRWFENYLEEERVMRELGSGNSDESGIRMSEPFMEAIKLKTTAPRTVSRPGRTSKKKMESKI